MATLQRWAPQVGVEDALHLGDPDMALALLFGHVPDQELEGIVIPALLLPKRPDERCLVPPEVQKLHAPARVPEEKHPCRRQEIRNPDRDKKS